MKLSEMVYLPKLDKNHVPGERVGFVRKAKNTLTKQERAIIKATDDYKLNPTEENKAALMKLIEETRGEWGSSSLCS